MKRHIVVAILSMLIGCGAVAMELEQPRKKQSKQEKERAKRRRRREAEQKKLQEKAETRRQFSLEDTPIYRPRTTTPEGRIQPREGDRLSITTRSGDIVHGEYENGRWVEAGVTKVQRPPRKKRQKPQELSTVSEKNEQAQEEHQDTLPLND